jgi:hypothetical protein
VKKEEEEEEEERKKERKKETYSCCSCSPTVVPFFTGLLIKTAFYVKQLNKKHVRRNVIH